MILIPNLFLLGFSAYGFKTSNSVWILNQCKQDSKTRYKTISISHVASNLGLGLSGFFISFMTQFGFQSIFYLSGILLLFSAMYILFQVSDDYIINRNRQDQKLASLATSKTIIVTLSCVFLVGLIIAQLGSTYPLYIQESFPKLGIHAVSILFILDTFLIVFFQAPLTSYLSNQNKFFITGFGALLMGTGMLILIYATTFSIAIFSCVIWTTGEMLFISTAQLLCYEGSKEHKKGQNLGLFQTVFASSNIIGPVVGGTIYHYMGGNILWYCSAVIGVLCCFICLNMGRVHTNSAF